MIHPAQQKLLDSLQRSTFSYFAHEVNRSNGLVRDRTRPESPSSIAATGFALAGYPIGVERGYMTRDAAIELTLACLRFFWNSPQGPERDATGYKGFYYHFLDMQSGRRAWKSELSSVDSTFLLAGMLTAAQYFAGETGEEAEIRSLAARLYARADWQWMLNGGPAVSHGWRPERGFIKYRWQGYSEALLLYVLGLGSPTHPLPRESYVAWTSSYKWKKIYGTELLYSGPLFTHQFSHMWLDFRGIRDPFMQSRGSDYFENTVRATEVQREYARRNPMGYTGYGDTCWGFTASDGPGAITCNVEGIQRRFHAYMARGAPYGPDDGTISPWATVASLPFAPEPVLAAIRAFDNLDLIEPNPYGFKTSFNQTFPNRNSDSVGWIATDHCGINQGPIVLMIENYRTELIWNLMRACPYVVAGLQRAGFKGGWL